MATVNEKMTAIADENRKLTGITDKLSLDNIISNLITTNNAITEQADIINEISQLINGEELKSENNNILNNTLLLTDLKHKIDDYIIQFDYCNVTFPSNGLGDKIYFTNSNGEIENKTLNTAQPFTIKVVKNSIIFSDGAIFSNDTFIIPDVTLATKLDNKAIVIHDNITFDYGDNAPS